MYPSHLTLSKAVILSAVVFLSSYTHSLFAAKQAFEQPIVVSIKPLHSLVSHITNGLHNTELLLKQQASAHHFQLLPSQKRMLSRAGFFFYSNPGIESFVRRLKQDSSGAQFIELAKAPGLRILTARSLHYHEHNNHQQAQHAEHASNQIDGHIWLSIHNARAIARYVSQVLSEAFPANRQQYQQNLEALNLKLSALEQQMKTRLGMLSDVPYLVYHDAFQYLELEQSLRGSHFVTTSPEHTPGIKRIRQLRALIKAEKIRCIFYEPPNIPALLQTLADDRSATLKAIDPIGSQIPAGKSHYFSLMSQTADALSDCLSST